MQIIIVSQTYSAGNGQASFTIHLAESMAECGHQVLVIQPAKNMHSSSRIQNGVQIEMIPALHFPMIHPEAYITPFPTPYLRKIMGTFQPDIVHIQDHYFLCNAAVNEARRLHIPVLGTNHFLPENLLPFLRKFPNVQRIFTFPLWKMMLAVFNKLEAATTPSKTAARILRKQKIHVPVHAISNGVDTNRFKPNPQVDRVGIRRKYNLASDKSIILYVGRLDGEKRLDTVLQAVALLPRADFQLAIAGHGLYEPLLRKQVQALGLEGRVVFIGFVHPDDLPSLYNSADIFVMPSPEELQSIATLEAMACGKPVLAADARALPELVSPGVNGFLFRACDAEDASSHMDHILNEHANWTRMGQAGFERAQTHSLQNTITLFEEHYAKVIEKPHSQSRSTAPSRSVVNKSI